MQPTRLLSLLQLQLLQQHVRRGDIAAAIESAIDTLQVSLREQQLDLWSHATAAVEASACADDHLVCAVCLDRLYCSSLPSPSFPCPSTFPLLTPSQSSPPVAAASHFGLSRTGGSSLFLLRFPLFALICLEQHIFHDACARSWLLQRQATCPLCR